MGSQEHQFGDYLYWQNHFSLEPQTTSLKWMFGETTIAHVKIWFIILLKPP